MNLSVCSVWRAIPACATESPRINARRPQYKVNREHHVGISQQPASEQRDDGPHDTDEVENTDRENEEAHDSDDFHHRRYGNGPRVRPTTRIDR